MKWQREHGEIKGKGGEKEREKKKRRKKWRRKKRGRKKEGRRKKMLHRESNPGPATW